MNDFLQQHFSAVLFWLLGVLSTLVIQGLTNIVSEIIKSFFGNKNKINDEKRKTYIQLINSMGIFIEGKFKGQEYKQAQYNFNLAYDYVWLWGNNQLIKELHSFLEKARELTELIEKNGDKDRIKSLKKQMEEQHVKIIFLLREDLGLKNEGLTKKDYYFFKLE